MPADNDLDPVDRWLNQQVWPMAPPDGAFEQITRRARRRKLRQAAVSVASAAAVVAAVAVAVPLGLSGGLGTSGPGPTSVAGGRGSTTPSSSQSVTGTGTRVASPGSTATGSRQPTPAGSGSATLGPNSPGWLPDKFIPATTTWVSQTVGYVMGQAGTPGKCGAEQDSSICTSIAITHDSGQTWAGVNAPVVGPANVLTGVSGLRFLDGMNGWAYGPELWATHDGGATWRPIDTGNLQVTDLETVNKRAYALWAKCTSENECSSYTLMSTPAGQDDWTPVTGVPAHLSAGSGTTSGSASFELGGDNGYLIAPDGSLYVGTLPGGPSAGSPSTWQRASASLPCKPSAQAAGPYGQSLQVLLAPYWGGKGHPLSVAVVCEANVVPEGYNTTVWVSTDNGASWTEQTNVAQAGVSLIGKALSLTATSNGGLILATQSGIYRLPPGASQWQKAALSGATAPPYGFSYVGMTTDKQGVAIADPAAAPNQPSPDPYGIWMTSDGGQTWQFRAIKSGS